MIDIGARIGLDGEAKYTQQIKDIIKIQRELKADMTKTTAAFDSNATSQDKAKAVAAQLERQLALQNEKLRVQNEQLRKMEQEGKGSTDAAKNLKVQIANTEAEIEKLNKGLRENNEILRQNQGMVQFGKDLQNAGAKMQSAGGKLKSFGSTMTRSVTAPIVAAGAAAVKLATDFETSMAKLNSIADTSEVSLDDLEARIMSLSNSSGIAASELAEQTYQAISAGRDTASSVQFVEQTTRLARSGFAETGSALDVLTTILNAYGKSASETESISDRLITTQNLGKTTVAQLAETMGQVIPTAAAYGVDLDNISAAYVTLTKQGVNTANATTQINNLMNQLGKSGTTASDVIRKKTGKSFKELMQSGASLADILKLVEEGAEEDGVALNDMFGNVRAGRAAMAIMNDAGVTFSNSLNAMADAAGATDKAFEKVTNTSAYRFEVALNQVKNTGIEAGREILITLAPAITKIGDIITKAIDKFDSLSDREQQSIIKLLGFAAAIGPATSALGGLTSGIGSAAEGAGKLIEKWGLMGKVPVSGIVGIAGAFVGISAALAVAQGEMEKFSHSQVEVVRESDKVASASADLRKEIDTASESYRNSSAEMDANEKHADELINELDKLSKQTDRTQSDNNKMVAAVEELNRLYPGLGLSIDSATGKLSKNTQEIRDNIKGLSEQARAIAAQERAVEINKELFSIESQLTDVTEQLAAARQAHTDALAQEKYEADMYQNTTTGAMTATTETARAVRDLTDEETGLQERQAELNKELELAEKYVTEHADALETNTEAAETTIQITEEVADELDEEAEAARKAAEEIASHAELSVGAFEKVEAAQTKSIQTMIENLKSQVAAQKNYNSNLQTLYAYVAKDTEHNWDQVIKIIQDGGINMAGELQGIVDAIAAGDTDMLNELAGLTLDVTTETAKSGAALNRLSGATEQAMNNSVNAIRKNKQPLMTEAKAAAQGIETGYAGRMTASQQRMYTDTHTAFGRARAGIRDSEEGLNTEANAAGAGVPKEYESGIKGGKPYDKSLYFINQSKKGLIDHKYMVERAADQVGASAIASLRAKYGEVVQTGEYLSDGLSRGLRNRADAVGAAAGSVATVAVNRLRAVPQVMSPSKVTTEIGEYIAEGLIVGMLAKIGEVKASAGQLARAALPGVGNTSIDIGGASLDPDAMYSAVRQGASEATQNIYLNGRDLTRSLKGMGVAFTNG